MTVSLYWTCECCDKLITFAPVYRAWRPFCSIRCAYKGNR